MPNKVKRVEDEEGIMSAAWDWWQGVELGLTLDVEIRMTRSKRKGVFVLVMTSRGAELGEDAPILSKVVREWPGSTPQSLGLTVFNMMCQLDRMAFDGEADRAKVARQKVKRANPSR